MRKLLAAFVILMATSCLTYAETYLDIGPFDTLGDLKAKFPNAHFSRHFPGWASASDALYEITGDGMNGSIVIRFHDPRPDYRKELQQPANDAYKSFLRQLIEQPDNEALTVDWVRWVPDRPIPLKRFISKYGKPDQSDYSDEDMHPIKVWKKGLAAFLSDDEKMVNLVDYQFTRKEAATAFKNKFGKPAADFFLERYVDGK